MYKYLELLDACELKLMFMIEKNRKYKTGLANDISDIDEIDLQLLEIEQKLENEKMAIYRKSLQKWGIVE